MISLEDLKCDIINTVRSEQLSKAKNTQNSKMIAEKFNSSKKSRKHQNSVKCVLFFLSQQQQQRYRRSADLTDSSPHIGRRRQRRRPGSGR